MCVLVPNKCNSGIVKMNVNADCITTTTLDRQAQKSIVPKLECDKLKNFKIIIIAFLSFRQFNFTETVPNIWALVYHDKLNPTHRESSFYGLMLRGFCPVFAVLILNGNGRKESYNLPIESSLASLLQKRKNCCMQK